MCARACVKSGRAGEAERVAARRVCTLNLCVPTHAHAC